MVISSPTEQTPTIPGSNYIIVPPPGPTPPQRIVPPTELAWSNLLAASSDAILAWMADPDARSQLQTLLGNASSLAGLTASQLKALGDTLRSVAPALIATLTAAQLGLGSAAAPSILRALSSEQIRYLNADVVSRLSAQELGAPANDPAGNMVTLVSQLSLDQLSRVNLQASFVWVDGQTYAMASQLWRFPGLRLGNSLDSGLSLESGQLIVRNGFELRMQPDGNLVIYDIKSQTPVWASGTFGHIGARASMQADGNLVIYDRQNSPLWDSVTYGVAAGGRLQLGADGTLSITNPATGSALWVSSPGNSSGQIRFATLSPAQIQNLGARAVNAMSVEALLTPITADGVHTPLVQLLQPSQLPTLAKSAAVLPFLSASQIQSLLDTEALSQGQQEWLMNRMIATRSGLEISRLDSAVFVFRSMLLMGGTDCAAALTCLSLEQIKTLPVTTLALLTPSELGLLSTAQVSALTKEQLRVLTNAQISALTELSPSQLNFVSGSGSSVSEAKPRLLMPGFTPTAISPAEAELAQLAATAARAGPTGAAIAAALLALSVAVSMASNEQATAPSTPAQVLNSTPNQLALIAHSSQSADIAALTRALRAFTPEQSALLSAEQLLALGARIQDISLAAIASLGAAQWTSSDGRSIAQFMSSAQISALHNTQAIGSSTLAQLRALDSNGDSLLARLSYSQIAALPRQMIEALTLSDVRQFSRIPAPAGQGPLPLLNMLSDAQISQLSTSLVSQLSIAELRSRNVAQAASDGGPGATTLQSLSANSVRAINPSAVISMSAEDLATISANGSSVLSNLSANQIPNIAPAVVATLSTAQLASVVLATAQSVTASLFGSQLRALTPYQIATLSATVLSQTSVLTPNGRTISVLEALSAAQVAQLSTSTIGQLSYAQLHLSNRQEVASPTYSSIGAPLNAPLLSVLQMLTSSQLGALDRAVVASLTPADLLTIDARGHTVLQDLGAATAHLTSAQFALLTTEQIQTIAGDGFTAAQLHYADHQGRAVWQLITPTQIGALTPALITTTAQGPYSQSIWTLAAERFLRAFTTPQVQAITPHVIGRLSFAQLTELNASGHTVLQDLSPDQVPLISGMNTLNAEQLTTLFRTLGSDTFFFASNLPYLTSAQLASIPSDVLVDGILGLGRQSGINPFNPTPVTAFLTDLTPEQLGTLPAAAIDTLLLRDPTIARAMLSAGAPDALSIDQFQGLIGAYGNPSGGPVNSLGSLHPDMLGTYLSAEALLALTPTQIAQITPAQLAEILRNPTLAKVVNNTGEGPDYWSRTQFQAISIYAIAGGGLDQAKLNAIENWGNFSAEQVAQGIFMMTLQHSGLPGGSPSSSSSSDDDDDIEIDIDLEYKSKDDDEDDGGTQGNQQQHALNLGGLTANQLNELIAGGSDVLRNANQEQIQQINNDAVQGISAGNLATLANKKWGLNMLRWWTQAGGRKFSTNQLQALINLGAYGVRAFGVILQNFHEILPADIALTTDQVNSFFHTEDGTILFWNIVKHHRKILPIDFRLTLSQVEALLIHGEIDQMGFSFSPVGTHAPNAIETILFRAPELLPIDFRFTSDQVTRLILTRTFMTVFYNFPKLLPIDFRFTSIQVTQLISVIPKDLADIVTRRPEVFPPLTSAQVNTLIFALHPDAFVRLIIRFPAGIVLTQVNVATLIARAGGATAFVHLIEARPDLVIADLAFTEAQVTALIATAGPAALVDIAMRLPASVSALTPNHVATLIASVDGVRAFIDLVINRPDIVPATFALTEAQVTAVMATVGPAGFVGIAMHMPAGFLVLTSNHVANLIAENPNVFASIVMNAPRLLALDLVLTEAQRGILIAEPGGPSVIRWIDANLPRLLSPGFHPTQAAVSAVPLDVFRTLTIPQIIAIAGNAEFTRFLTVDQVGEIGNGLNPLNTTQSLAALFAQLTAPQLSAWIQAPGGVDLLNRLNVPQIAAMWQPIEQGALLTPALLDRLLLPTAHPTGPQNLNLNTVTTGFFLNRLIDVSFGTDFVSAASYGGLTATAIRNIIDVCPRLIAQAAPGQIAALQPAALAGLAAAGLTRLPPNFFINVTLDQMAGIWANATLADTFRQPGQAGQMSVANVQMIPAEVLRGLYETIPSSQGILSDIGPNIYTSAQRNALLAAGAHGNFGFAGKQLTMEAILSGASLFVQQESAQANTALANSAQGSLEQLQQLLGSGNTSASISAGAVWKAKPGQSQIVVTWSVPAAGNEISSAITKTEDIAAIKAAFETWSGPTGIIFKQVDNAGPADITLGYSDLGTAVTGVVGYTTYEARDGQMQSAQILLEDPNETALSGVGASGMYAGTMASLMQVLLHEIGHALGLLDNAAAGSIENYYLGPDNQTLSAADIQAVGALYGATGAAGTATGNDQASTALAPVAPIPGAATNTSTVAALNALIQSLASVSASSSSAATGSLSAAMDWTAPVLASSAMH